MTFGLAAPLALAALAALVVPIVLHLVRRAEQRDTPFAALRFLRPAGLPRRRIRVAELALLLLRCLLLALLAAWLALPFVRREAPVRHVVAVVAPVTAAQARAAVRTDAASELVWLAEGFPPVEQTLAASRQPHASLLRELDATLSAGSRLDLVVPATLDGLDGERPALSRAVGWHVVADARAEPQAPAREPDVVALRVPSDDATQARYVDAISQAWASDGWRTVPVSGDAIPDGARYAVWLGAAPGDAALRWADRGGTLFVAGDTGDEGDVLARGDDGAPLVRARRAGAGRIVALAVPFAPAALPRMNDPAFPRELARWLRGDPAPPRTASAQAVQPVRRDAAHAPTAESLAPWFAWLAAALFVLERLLGQRARTTGGARMNDVRAPVPDALARWRRRARTQRAAVVLAAALPLVAAASWLASHASPAALAVTAATTLGAAFALAVAHARRADLAHVARRADAEQAVLEDSATLALADDAGLNPLQRLQQARIRERLARVEPPTREPVPWRVLAFAWLAALALVAINLVPGRATAPRGGDGVAASDAPVPPTAIARAELAIEPPAYTGLPPRTARELDARVETGAVVRWTLEITPRPDAVSLRFHDGETVALAADGDAWRGERRIDKSTLYRIVLQGVAPRADDRNQRIDAIPDRAPEIRVVAPERTLTPLEGGQSQWQLSFEASDDYGVADATLAITNAKGTGENIEVSKSSHPLRGEGEARARRYRHAIALAPYAMAPGDDLIVKLTVRDNRAPAAQSAQSASYILRAPFEPAGESTGVEGLVRDTLPAYFRSQRQIIIDTEALLAEAPKLAHDTLVERSDAIGVDQRVLRMRYGQFLGEESSEIDEAEHEAAGHDEGARPGATSREILEAFGHTHDDSEAATLLDPETKKLLREALAAMWDAEGQLRSGAPKPALPHEYRALEKIKQVQHATRIYLARVGLELPQLDESRRLSGDRAGVRDRVAPLVPASVDDAVVIDAWQALARRERPDVAALKAWAVANEDSLADPLAWFDVLERWETDPACGDCADAASKLVWPSLPASVPAARPRVATDAAARAYLERIQEPAE